ncbi:MAG TPA: hypothetical protein GXZ74_07220 [Tissierellia bacterium]|nr:hypothetical protein [Tissierellia bacterium]
MRQERGSITVFLTILLAFLLIIGLIVSEYAHIRFSFRKAQADQYLALDQALSDFDRPLFQEMGLLGVETDRTEYYFQPLSEREVLEASILALMEERRLVDLTNRVEDLINQLLDRLLGLDFELFDVQELNDDLHQLLARDVESDDIASVVAEFVVRIVAAKPYVELRGISFDRLKDLLFDLKFEEIKQLSPYFTLKDNLRENYSRVRKTLQKYDRLRVLDRFDLADYAVDYLGYSLTRTDKETLHTEFILTSAETKRFQRPIISAELFALRLTLNLIEVTINPVMRNRVIATTGGIPKLFALEALRLAATEAYMDVRHILDRKPVPLYKGTAGWLIDSGGFKRYSSGWTYPDYLKVMLMLTPKSIYYNRLQHALEHNYDLDLRQTFTAVKDEREVTITGNVLRRDFTRRLKGELYYVRPGIDQP